MRQHIEIKLHLPYFHFLLCSHASEKLQAALWRRLQNERSVQHYASFLQLCHPDAQHSGLLRHVAAGRRMDRYPASSWRHRKLQSRLGGLQDGFRKLGRQFLARLGQHRVAHKWRQHGTVRWTVVLWLQRCRRVCEVQSVQPSSRMAAKIPATGVWVRGIFNCRRFFYNSQRPELLYPR